MLYNLQNNKDLITVDLRVKQVRYLHNVLNHGRIEFFDLSHDDVDGYEYLFNNSKNIFLKTLADDVESNLGIKVNVKNLRVKL